MPDRLTVDQALNLARGARAINATERDVPANAALVVLADELLALREEVHNESHRCSCVFEDDKPLVECWYHMQLREEVERLKEEIILLHRCRILVLGTDKQAHQAVKDSPMTDRNIRLEKLDQSLRRCDGYENDHDYICACRPADLRYALKLLRELRTEVEQLKEIAAAHVRHVEHGEECASCDCDELREQVKLHELEEVRLKAIIASQTIVIDQRRCSDARPTD